MSTGFERRVETLISAVVVSCIRARWAVLALYLVVSGLAGWYTVSHVAINTNTEDMLAADLPWRVAYTGYKEAFPFFSDTLVVVVDAPTPDLADEAAERLAAALRDDPAHFGEVFDPPAMPFFRRNQFLYLESSQLETLINAVSRSQVFLGQLAADPGLNGFLVVLGQLANSDTALPEGIGPMLEPVADTFKRFAGNESTAPLSWQRMLGGGDHGASARRLFTVLPKLDFGSLLPAGEPIEALRAHVEALGYPEGQLEVRLTGGAALGYDELSSVMRGAQQAATLAFVMVAVCLVIGLRSGALVVATLCGLVVGLMLTACFATFAVGTLNMISVAFAVLYVGLGVDFAIHLGLRYRELCAGRPKRDALLQAGRHVGVSLALCALTTAIGFLAFIPTDYRGVAELGLISGVGIVIGLVVSLTLLPALLEILPAPRPKQGSRIGRALTAGSPRHHDRRTLLLTLGLALGATLSLPYARFDHNPLHLNDPDAESVRVFDELDRDDALYRIATVEPDAVTAERLATALRAVPSVASVTTAADLVPQDQDGKLSQIDMLAFTLGDVGSVADTTPIESSASLARLRGLETRLRKRPEQAPSVLETLADAIGAAADRLEALAPAARAAALEDLEYRLMHHFPAQLARLGEGLQAQAVSMGDLPEPLLRRWVTADGRQRVEIKPRENLDDNAHLARFVDEVRLLTGPRATGTPVINIEASRAVTLAFAQAFATATLVISALLFIILRRLTEVLVVLAPLALAGLLTTAAVVVLGQAFNFANIIALPLLMGIGVDSALHILHRYKTTGREDTPLLASSTARGVLFSALTTATSFGNLASSPHAGTASMGLVLSIGLLITLVATLVVQPALLRQYVQPTGSLT